MVTGATKGGRSLHEMLQRQPRAGKGRERKGKHEKVNVSFQKGVPPFFTLVLATISPPMSISQNVSAPLSSPPPPPPPPPLASVLGRLCNLGIDNFAGLGTSTLDASPPIVVEAPFESMEKDPVESDSPLSNPGRSQDDFGPGRITSVANSPSARPSLMERTRER